MDASIALLLVLVLIASTIVSVLPFKAEARTIIVPDNYSTIQGALISAKEGDTIFVKKGTYHGPVNQTLVIDKTLSLIGENPKTTIINLHPELKTVTIITQTFLIFDIALRITAADVKISGFTINSDCGGLSATGNRTQITGNIINTGVTLAGAHQTVYENIFTANLACSGTYGSVFKNDFTNCSIACDGSYNSVFANSVIGGNMGSGGTSNLLYGNIVKDGRGISVAGFENIVAKNKITNCTMGVGILWGGGNFVYGNNITNCNGIGLYKTDSHGGNVFYANHVENNFCGAKIAFAAPFSDTELYCNNFVNNIEQVNRNETETVSGAGYNFTRPLYHSGYFDNGKVGNYWSDYTGVDADGDGIGDTPYAIDEERKDNYPLMAPVNIDTTKVKLPHWANLTAIGVPESNAAEPFPIALSLVAIGASAAVVSISLLVYFKKPKKEKWL